MSSQNEASWLTGVGKPLEVRPTELRQPGPGGILVKNQAWAINPIDHKMQALGILIKSWPTTIGTDLAGEVVGIGEDVLNFKVGDMVAGLPIAFASGRTDGGAFQSYTIIPARAAFAIPQHLAIEDAVKLPLGISTASSGLYEKQYLALPYPQFKPKSTGTTIMIWGATSNVGSAAVQLAAASGIEVVATASSGKEAAIEALGASKVFDYRSTTIVEDMVSYLKSKTIAGAFDAISSPQTGKAVSQILAQLGGGKLAVTQPQAIDAAVDSVEAKLVQSLQIFTASPEVGKAVFQDFLPAALRTGKLKAYQKTQIVGHGLKSIQTGLDEMAKSPSGTKLVVLA